MTRRKAAYFRRCEHHHHFGRFFLHPRRARDNADAATEIAKFTGGKIPQTGRITIELPEIAENGNSVRFRRGGQSDDTRQLCHRYFS